MVLRQKQDVAHARFLRRARPLVGIAAGGFEEAHVGDARRPLLARERAERPTDEHAPLQRLYFLGSLDHIRRFRRRTQRQDGRRDHGHPQDNANCFHNLPSCLSGHRIRGQRPRVSICPATTYHIGSYYFERSLPSCGGSSNWSQGRRSSTMAGPIPLICWRSSAVLKAGGRPAGKPARSRCVTIARARAAPTCGSLIRLATGASLGLIRSFQGTVVGLCERGNIPATKARDSVRQTPTATRKAADWVARNVASCPAGAESGSRSAIGRTVNCVEGKSNARRKDVPAFFLSYLLIFLLLTISRTWTDTAS